MLFLRLAERLPVNVLLQFYRLYKIFCKVLFETNVNISNELNFSDVYQSVNYIGLLAKLTRTPLGCIHFACNPV